MNTCPRDNAILASNDVNGYRYYSCEHCNGSWIPGASLDRVLSARGMGELRSIRRDAAGEMFCPDCHALCDIVVIAGCRLDCCPRCRGVWLDAGEAQKVSHLFPMDSAVVDADKGHSAKAGQTVAGAASAVDLVGNLWSLLRK